MKALIVLFMVIWLGLAIAVLIRMPDCECSTSGTSPGVIVEGDGNFIIMPTPTPDNYWLPNQCCNPFRGASVGVVITVCGNMSSNPQGE